MLLDSVCTSLESNNNSNNSYAKHHRFMPKWCKVDDLGRPTPPPRHGHRAVTIKGLMLVFGGGNEGIVNELHVYDSSTNTWCVPDLRGHRPPGFAAYGMVTNQSKVFIFGGMIEYGRYSNDLYELQINRWEWRKLNIQILEGLPEPPCPRLGHTFTMGSNNIAYVFGGLANISENRRENMPKYLNDLYTIDLSTAPSGLYWHCPKTNCQPPPPRESHTAVHFTTNTGNEQLIIYGGMNGQRLGDVWILDLESMNWSNPLPQGFGPLPRSLHTANLIENRMFIFGGWVPIDPDDKLERPNQGWKCTSTLAVLNLSTLRWELSLGPPTFDTTITTYSIDTCWPSARAGHCSAVINKRIYIWSGRDGYKKLQNSQVCCKDMFYLETEPPAVPSSIQLVKASVNSLEISWSPSTTADRYVLQIQRAEHQLDPEKVGRRSAGGVRVAQRQQHFANVGAGGGGGGGTPLSSSSHNQQQRAVLTSGGGSSNSASSSPVRAFRPTSMSNTVTGSSSPFHHRRYYQQPHHHHQQQLHLSTSSASVGSSPVLLAARPLRIKPSAGATSSCPRPSSIVVQQQPQHQLRIVQQHMNRNDVASTGGNVGGGTTDAAVVTASSSPVSSLHHHHSHQQHQQLNMTTPRTIVVHKSSSSLVPSSDAEGGGGGVADPATTTTIPPLVAGPKRFYVHTSAPSHQQQQHVVAAVVGAQQPPVIVRRQMPNCPPRQPRQDIATSSNTFDILAPPAKMVKHMEFVPTVSGIISPTEPPLSSTTTTKTTTYSVPAAPVVVDQTMPHNILETFLNEAENFVEHHGQPPCNVDNANENIDSQSAEQQQQQIDGTTSDGGGGNPLAVEAKTAAAAATHQHHDQIGDDDHEGGGDDYDEKEINNEQQQIETGGGEQGGQEGGKNIANDIDDDGDAKSKWTTTSDAEALGMTMTKSEDNNNMFNIRATTTNNNDNDNTTDKSDVEKMTDDNSVVVGDEYAQLGVEQMRSIDPDSEKDAAALKEEAAERHNAPQLLQPLERDYEQQQHHQQQQQEDDQLLLDVSAVVDEPLPEEQQQPNQQQQQQHVVGGGGDDGGEQSQQQFATEEEEEQPVGSDEQPQPQQVVQQQQYAFRHYQQQPQFQHVPADMVASGGGGRATAATQQHQQHPMDAEKEEMEEEQDELGNSIGIGTRIVSIAEQQHVQQLLPMSVVESSSSSMHGRRQQQQQQDITAAQPEHHQHPIPIGQRRSASSSASDFVAQHLSPFDSGNKWFHVVDLPSSEQRFVITEYSVPCYDRGGGGGSGSATTAESVRRKRRAIEYASQLPDEQQQQQEQQQKTAAATEQIALEPGTLYRIRVRAVNSVGCSAWSQPVSFKTCVPGFPGSPTSIKITKCPEGVYISWDPPLSPNGQIEEYSVFLLMRSSQQHQQQHASMMRSQHQQQQQSVAVVSSFTRVYMGPAPNCVISHSVLGMAHVDTASTPKPAIIFRISARNEKGYGSATQVRWLQESPRVVPLAVMPPGTLQPMSHGTLLTTTTTTGPSLPSSLPSSGDTTAQLMMPQQQQQQLYHHQQQQHHHVLSLPSSATAAAGGRAVQQHQHRRSAASPAAVVYQQPQQQQHQQHYHHHNQQRSTAAANMMMSSGRPANMNISVREFLSNSNNAAANRGGDR
ncbi:hypothetical protein niasHT_004369 [Heterodera trifolii]|uniref:Fibronectin type-III domain-containing protein n=1 Tax=Heterodera trifolii TaxID=157864 RepID=A0ABD2LSM8_9BILA